jgi:hypothetical protein
LVFNAQDVDIVVSEYPDEVLGLPEAEKQAEKIKDIIERADGRYFLEPSRRNNATYLILYCRLPGWNTNGRCVKVDILVPPTIGLPVVTDSEAILRHGIPVIHILDLLLMKIQGWWRHRTQSRDAIKAKHDVYEIFALLEWAREARVSYVNKANEFRYTPKFRGRARTLVNTFVHFNGGREQWRALQFPVSTVASSGAHDAARDKIVTNRALIARLLTLSI